MYDSPKLEWSHPLFLSSFPLLSHLLSEGLLSRDRYYKLLSSSRSTIMLGARLGGTNGYLNLRVLKNRQTTLQTKREH